MFFDNPNKIPDLYRSYGFSIIVAASSPEVAEKEMLVIEPQKNGQITIDQIREIIDTCKAKRTAPFYIFVKNAESMNEKAQNAFLKLLEEPAENYHICLFTSAPSALLETILSRGQLYIERSKNSLSAPIQTENDIKAYAKRLITASNKDLLDVVKDITSEKEFKKNSRGYTLSIISCAIEILYKSYFSTGNSNFLKKLPNMLNLYDNLKQNGHLKLHLIADLC